MVSTFLFVPNFSPTVAEASTAYNHLNRRELAAEIIRRSTTAVPVANRISFANWVNYGQTNDNGRSVYQNLRDTANGHRATTRWYPRFDQRNPFLDEDLLRAILILNDTYRSFQINALAGQNHTGRRTDEHYRGFAVDIQNGTNIHANNRATVINFIGQTFYTQANSGINIHTRREYDRCPTNNPGNGLASWINNCYIGTTATNGQASGAFHLEIWGRRGSGGQQPNPAPGPVAGTQFRINLGSTSVRTNINGPNVTTIPAGATLTRTSDAHVELGGWTWIRGRLTGTVAQTTGTNGVSVNNQDVWISTSQLTRLSGGPAGTCNIVLSGTVVRHSASAGAAGSVATLPAGATFQPSGDARVQNASWTWILGTITGTAAQTTATNGTNWNGRLMWIATSQLTNTAICN
jgi:hypothetical protein